MMRRGIAQKGKREGRRKRPRLGEGKESFSFSVLPQRKDQEKKKGGHPDFPGKEKKGVLQPSNLGGGYPPC